MMGMFAKRERNMIGQRVRSRMDNAKSKEERELAAPLLLLMISQTFL